MARSGSRPVSKTARRRRKVPVRRSFWQHLDPGLIDWKRIDWRFAAPALALLLAADPMASADPDNPAWDRQQIAQLRHLIETAPEDALPRPDTSALDRAIRRGQPGAVNRAASALALQMARQHLIGLAPPSERIEWYIVDTDRAEELGPGLAAALREDRLAAFIEGMKPQHPDYQRLRSAYGMEADPARRIALARTMERWRWLPRSLGENFIMANAAGFEVKLWRRGELVKRWAAISGKASTQTPSLMAEAVAVNFNPWWEVPASIAKESGMRAGRRYIWSGTHFRQPPGPGNALGRMKLLMPNKHNIYLHDTPSRGLFGAEQRAFSHGCLRVDDALGFAHTLLDGTRSRDQIDKLFKAEPPKEGEAPGPPAQPKTSVVPLPVKLPVYVTYMTVTVRADGTAAYHKDIYGRDAKIVLLETRRVPQLAVQ